MDGFLLLKFWAEGELVYMMPIGNGDLNKVLNALIEDANREGEPFLPVGYLRRNVRRIRNFYARQIPVHSRQRLRRLYIPAL